MRAALVVGLVAVPILACDESADCADAADCADGQRCLDGRCVASASPDAGPAGPRNLQTAAVEAGQAVFQAGAGLAVRFDLAIDLAPTSIGPPTASLPPGFVDAPYYGALDPAEDDPWWLGWTYVDARLDGNLPGPDLHPLEADVLDGSIAPAPASRCGDINPDFIDTRSVTVFGIEFPVCLVREAIERDTELTNDHLYLLSGVIDVGFGAERLRGGEPSASVTLRIKEGTQIMAAAGSATALVVTRGSRIEATGTAERPIVLGAVETTAGPPLAIAGDPTDLSGRGEWGALVLSGRASVAGQEDGDRLAEAETVPSGRERWHGGTDDDDSSGSLRYVIVAESGFEFRPEPQAPNLVLESVGRNTEVEFVQLIGTEDDGLEIVGGTVDVGHAVIVGADDDAIDVSGGYRGHVQFALIRMGASNGDRGLEVDGSPGNFDAAPMSAPRFANITVLGNAGGPNRATVGLLVRTGASGQVYRSVFTDDLDADGAFEDGCFDVDDVLRTTLQVRDAIFNCAPAPLHDDVDDLN